MRVTAVESSNATAATSSLVKTGIIAMLGAGVKIAEPAVAQNGQTCEAYPPVFVSAHRWNWPARNRIASAKTNRSRRCFPLMYLVRGSLGKKGWRVKRFAEAPSPLANGSAFQVRGQPK